MFWFHTYKNLPVPHTYSSWPQFILLLFFFTLELQESVTELVLPWTGPVLSPTATASSSCWVARGSTSLSCSNLGHQVTVVIVVTTTRPSAQSTVGSSCTVCVCVCNLQDVNVWVSPPSHARGTVYIYTYVRVL